MRNPAQRLREHDPALLHKLAMIEQGYLAVVVLVAVGSLWIRRIAPLDRLMPPDWVGLSPEIAIAALLSAVGLEFSRPRHSGPIKRIGLALAFLLALLSGAVLVKDLFHVGLGANGFAAAVSGSAHSESMPALTAAAFAALAAVMLLTPAKKGLASYAADLFVSFFCLMVLVMVRGYLFEGFSHFGGVGRTSLLTLLAMSLLAFVAFMHRAEVGIFATLLGEGSGSRIARIAAPIVLLVPFLPQSTLAHAVKTGQLHAEYLSALIAFLAAGVSLTLMLYMAFKINRLEMKIRDLSLRDEVTGLLNRRGFHLVAWQILRQARRDGLPFSVMFIDLENLAEIHSSFGPQASSQSLVEMAEALTAAFRATDVLGRIDPGQFALAGHFDEKSSNVMRLRLQESVNYRNSSPGRNFAMNISIAFAFTKDPRQESLDDLLAEADNARNREFQGAEPIARTSPQNTRR
jgi:diguanylate cyclase (GGDEF)-like protein